MMFTFLAFDHKNTPQLTAPLSKVIKHPNKFSLAFRKQIEFFLPWNNMNYILWGVVNRTKISPDAPDPYITCESRINSNCCRNGPVCWVNHTLLRTSPNRINPAGLFSSKRGAYKSLYSDFAAIYSHTYSGQACSYYYSYQVRARAELYSRNF